MFRNNLGPTWLTLAVFATSVGARDIDFGRDIRPLLSDTCYRCHGPDDENRVSSFRLDSQSGLFGTLDSGKTAIVPFKPNESVVLQRLVSTDPQMQMPPPGSGQSLTTAQTDLIRKWIKAGAVWEPHWSFVVPQRPEVPPLFHDLWCRNEIDCFVLQHLREAGLTPSPVADKRTLLRRVSLDLTGLPPSLEELQDFLQDKSPTAWQTAIERLLHSPRYGERQAVDWLDAARYADTSGYQNDGPRDMWRWRDWVIEAFNSNMPFDRFTIEQLAGDMLPAATLSQKIATGFNRNHRGNAEGGIIPEEYQVEYVVDRVDTTATVWLGLTMGCARCHDHKYDPVSQEDFYRIFAYFNNVPEHGRAIKEGNSPPWIKAPTAEQAAKLKHLDQQLSKAIRRVADLQNDLDAELAAWTKQPAAGVDAEWTIRRKLVGHFRFDDTFQNSSVNAYSERQRAEHAAPEEFRTGISNRAAFFDGQTVANVGDVAGFGYFDRFSISAWVRPADLTGTILSRMKPVEEGNGYALRLQNGKLQLNLVKRWLDDAIRVESRVPLPLNEWQHVAVSYDGSRRASGIKAYINGREVPLTIKLDSINQSFSTNEPLRFGGGHDYFTGLIDEAHLFSRVLDADEVATLATPDSVAAIASARRTEDAELAPGKSAKLKAFFVDRHASAGIRDAYTQLVKAQNQRDQFERSIPTVMVMEELDQPRQTFLLERGRYDARGRKLEPGIPAALASPSNRQPTDRLGFAKWIASDQNPLTARVAVNRIWQQHFGRGLVNTPEDFGAQGEAPSHPELLDWLATEFVRCNWNIKAMHRMIVNSATYRQSSIEPESQGATLDNRNLARGPRFRLPAETVRDQALFLAGLLKERIGGPSVRPYQPEGLWKEIASTTEYHRSTGDDLYRRSLYTYWKRTVAPPTMVTFDATSREACVVSRSQTNTPLQALALMNDPTFVEASRGIATRMLNRDDLNTRQKLSWGFELATCRPPNSVEMKVLERSLQRGLDRFQTEPEAAEALMSVGESPLPVQIDTQILAAWTVTAGMILNLDEVITLH